MAPPALVAPVPPFAMVHVPPNVIVPLDVMGPPLVFNPVAPPETATFVTVPALAVVQATELPFVVNTFPLLPVCSGTSAFMAPDAVVCPVPPLDISKVPLSKISPVDDAAGEIPDSVDWKDVTPVLVMVMSPVLSDTEMPVPAVLLNTPVLEIVLLAMLIPVPAA